MNTPVKAEPEPQPCYRIRLVFQNAIIYALSLTRPRLIVREGRIVESDLEIVAGTTMGDEIGFLDWSAVVAVSWRKARVPYVVDPEFEGERSGMGA